MWQFIKRLKCRWWRESEFTFCLEFPNENGENWTCQMYQNEILLTFNSSFQTFLVLQSMELELLNGMSKEQFFVILSLLPLLPSSFFHSLLVFFLSLFTFEVYFVNWIFCRSFHTFFTSISIAFYNKFKILILFAFI